jgi:uncharacterized protein YjiK
MTYMPFRRNTIVILCILIQLVLAPGCGSGPNSPKELRNLELVGEYPLAFEGPSGLALDPSGEFLWSVSDVPGGSIYRISFTGEILGEIQYDSEDMEGIAIHPSNGSIWVVEERARELVNLTRSGTVIRRVPLNIERQNDNDGPEGVAINPNNGHFFVVNEKNPRLLVELNPQFEIINTIVIDFPGIFAVGDLSGITYNTDDNTLWLLSDESAKIVAADTEGNPLYIYETNVNDGEGIAIDVSQGKVYIVSDDERMLYVYIYQ